MITFDPRSMGTPTSSAITCSEPPGAQAPSQGASSMDSPSARSPVSPKQVHPSPGSAASLSWAAAIEDGGSRNRMTWCTTDGVPGRMLRPVTKASRVRCGSSTKQR